MQKRWVAGIVFATGFLWGFCWLMFLALGNIIDYYKMAFEFDTHAPNPVAPSAFIAPLAIAMGFYLISLFDVFVAYQRIARTKREKVFSEESLSKGNKVGDPPATQVG